MEDSLKPGGSIRVHGVETRDVLLLALKGSASLAHKYCKLMLNTSDEMDLKEYKSGYEYSVRATLAISKAIENHADHVDGITPEDLYLAARDAAEEKDSEDATFLNWKLSDIADYKRRNGLK